MIRRPPRSTPLYSSAASDVYKRQVHGIGFSEVPEGCTLDKAIELTKVPESANIPGMREMTKEDVPQVRALLSEYLKKFTLYPIFTEEGIAHWLLPRKDIVQTFVVVDAENKATDFVSYHIVPYNALKAGIEYQVTFPYKS
eukprot:TRINITY_DN840_c0_g1_i5.p1 TRINITY_DN840_c0_g1~~TRINITY_DN840_c0_g1_i5.p1  ORF type:complete len:159 (-),score=40.68 TRINITY_DN840_c0_g1_i5:436-858(-)